MRPQAVLVAGAFVLAAPACSRPDSPLVVAAQDYEHEACSCTGGDVPCAQQAEQRFLDRECALGADPWPTLCPGHTGEPRRPPNEVALGMKPHLESAHACFFPAILPCGGPASMGCESGYRCDTSDPWGPMKWGRCVKSGGR
jgi:hypothetical protein